MRTEITKIVYTPNEIWCGITGDTLTVHAVQYGDITSGVGQLPVDLDLINVYQAQGNKLVTVANISTIVGSHLLIQKPTKSD